MWSREIKVGEFITVCGRLFKVKKVISPGRMALDKVGRWERFWYHLGYKMHTVLRKWPTHWTKGHP